MFENLVNDTTELAETRKKEYINANARVFFYMNKLKNIENNEWYKAASAMTICFLLAQIFAVFFGSIGAVSCFFWFVTSLCLVRLAYIFIYTGKYKYFLNKNDEKCKLAFYRYKNALFLQQRAVITAALEKDAQVKDEEAKEFFNTLHKGISLHYITEKDTSL